MYIHNTMEDIVLQYLEEILSLKKDICKCEQCKTDMACYALNKISPMYIVSSRGIIHTENKKREHIQEEVDIYAIVSEAIDIVANTRRHEVDDQYKNIELDLSKHAPKYRSDNDVFFNFPQVIGRIFDSSIPPI